MKTFVSTIDRYRNPAIFLCLLALIPLWNIDHTIAARYLFASLLFLVVVVSKPDWKLYFRSNIILLALFAYLIIHLIFFSTDFKYALGNFSGEWAKFILFACLGAGIGLLLFKIEPRKLVLFLAFAFSIPLLIHLGLSIQEGLSRGGIPWFYWGISEHHNLIGYPGLHAVIFSSTFFLFLAKSRFDKLLGLFLLGACFASLVISGGRASTAFAFLALLFVYLVNVAVVPAKSMSGRLRQFAGWAVIVLVLMAVAKVGAEVYEGKWTGVVSRMRLGLEGDALRANCEGAEVIRRSMIEAGKVMTPEISKALESFDKSDGDIARIATARAALRLSLANPMGIDQSREAYQIALGKFCDPKVMLAHAHNGWLDTALAIGIPGALLYLLVLLNFARLGIRHMREKNVNQPVAVALFVLSAIWILRALVDSSQRNQMLEMQAFTICLLYGFIVSHKKND